MWHQLIKTIASSHTAVMINKANSVKAKAKASQYKAKAKASHFKG